MASALPGRPPRQTPRFNTIVLAALEDYVVGLDTPKYWRVFSWWLLVQCWATLRFDDHRGIVPSELNVTEAGLKGKLRRSKVSGPDKKLNFRIVVVHPSAYETLVADRMATPGKRGTLRTRLPPSGSVQQL